jgi:hypothetical protein
MRASCRTRLARRMADRESLLTHWIQSPVRAAGLGTQRDFGCRLLAVGHGCAGAPAGAVHKAESRASGDLDVVRRQYVSLTTALLIKLGSNFDVASRGEIELCLCLGADPARLSYCNTVKKERDIAAAYRRGVRLFTVPSAETSELGRPTAGKAAGHRHETRQSRC